MTGNYNDKVRAVVLAALMVLSVFAGTVAFAGSASANIASGPNATTTDALTPASSQGADTLRIQVDADVGAQNTGQFIIPMDALNETGVDFTSSFAVSDSASGGDTSVGDVTYNGFNNTVTVNATDQGGSGNTVDVTVQVSGLDASGVDDTATFDVTARDVDNGGSASTTVDATVDTLGPAIDNAVAFDNLYETSTPQSIVGENGGSAVITASSSSEVAGSITVDQDETVVELTFNESISGVGGASVSGGTAPETSDFRVTLSDGTSVQPDAIVEPSTSTDGQIFLIFDDQRASAVDSVNVTTFSHTADFTDANGAQVAGSVNQDVNVQTGTSSLVAGGAQYEDTSPSDNTLGNNNAKRAFVGSTVAYVGANANDDVTIETANEEYVFDGTTGTDSYVYLFNTEDRNNSAIYQFEQTSSSAQSLRLSNLGLGVSVADTEIQTDEELEVTVEANSGNRDVEFQLVDSSGDDFGNAVPRTLNGSGGFTYAYGTSTFSDEDTGNYTVEVTDLNSDVTVESSSVQVSEAGEGTADFGQSTYTDQRGDIVNITVEMEETSTSTVKIGSDGDGFRTNVTVEDNNGDEEVLLQFNTWAARGANNGTVSGDGGPVFNAYNADDVDSDDEDVVLSADIDPNNEVTDLLDDGDYEMEVRSDISYGASSQNAGTLILEERSTDEIVSWTAPSGEAPADLDELREDIADENVTQSSDVANGDVVVHQLVATGLEGALETASGSNTTAKFFARDGGAYNLTVNQSNPGANRNAYGLVINETNSQVISDAHNDTYYVIFDLDDPVAVNRNDMNYFYDSSQTTDTIEDDDVLQANFTVYENDGNLADSDQTVITDYEAVNGEVSTDADPVNVTNAEGQQISGTATVAPGTELTVRVDSDDGVRPSFLKTTDVYVQGDGSWSATFDFSEQNVGDSFTIESTGGDGVIVSDDQLDVDGNVVESTGMTTTEPADTTTEPADTTTEPADTTTEPADTTTEPADTTTEEPATETPTSTPGFGVVVALTALIAAALLAIRRD